MYIFLFYLPVLMHSATYRYSYFSGSSFIEGILVKHSSQQTIFITISFVYWDGIILGGCLKRMALNFIFAIILVVAYFCSKKLITCGYLVK